MKTKLQSKKNQVFFVEEEESFVSKVFQKKESYFCEVAIYDVLRRGEVPVPDILFRQEGRRLDLSYIQGQTALEKLEHLESLEFQGALWHDEKNILVDGLCNWLFAFYKILMKEKGTPWIFGDLHLRNFLFQKETNLVYGIDFEECTCGRWERDIGRLCAFILTYSPEYTKSKVTVSNAFLEKLSKGFSLEEKLLEEEFQREMRGIGKRRGMEVKIKTLKELSQCKGENRGK